LDQAAEIALVKSTVARFFTVYDVKVSYESVEVLISPDAATLESRFEDLRKEMYSQGYIPILDYSKGEYSVTVVRKPPAVKRRIWINIVFLVATCFTTIYAGMILWASYVGSLDFWTLSNFFWGVVSFAFPLMLILGVHELSHYYMSKKHGVDASLPYFIPAPPIIGTFGAFISMREPMPNKKALIDIGVAGPLGGLLVSIPVAIIGLLLNQGAPPHPLLPPAGQLGVNFPLLYQLLLLLVPIPENVFMHPTAFAAWVGIFVTAINLLPAGQLDGGHIARGLLGKNARFLSIATVIVLFVLGFFYYTGWLLFAFLIAVLGLSHPAPLNDVSKLDTKRVAVGALALVILVASFVFVPLYSIPYDATFDLEPQGSNETVAVAGGVAIFYVALNSTGTMNMTVEMFVQDLPENWSAIVYPTGNSSGATGSLSTDLPYGQSFNLTVEVLIPDSQGPGNDTFVLSASSHAENASQTTQLTEQFMVRIV
jgi:membrane-associated protease RseP (regulator of RpoE activity)